MFSGQIKSPGTSENIILKTNLQTPMMTSVSDSIEREEASKQDLQQNSDASYTLVQPEVIRTVNNTISNQVLHIMPEESNIAKKINVESFHDKSSSNSSAFTSDERISQATDYRNLPASQETLQMKPTTYSVSNLENVHNVTTPEEMTQINSKLIHFNSSELEQ